jgi:O-antigen ligase
MTTTATTVQTTRASKIGFVLINAVVIFTALAYGTVHQPVIALFYVIVGALVLTWIADCLTGRALRLSTSFLQLPIAAYAIYGLVQALPLGGFSSIISDVPRTLSAEPHATVATSIHLLVLLAFFSVCLVFIDSASRIRRVAAVLTIFGFAFAFFAILQGLLSPTKIYGIYERQFASPYGSFVNRHNFAAYMEMTLAIPFALVLTGAIKRDKRLLYITAVSLMGIALLLSGSRGGFVALLAEIALLLILTRGSQGRRSLALKAALTAALLLAVIGGAIFVGGESSLSRIAETAQSEDITNSRTHIWSVTLDVIKHNLPFGAGIGAFDVAYTPYDSFNGLERVEQAHNDYLQVLADAGLVGLAIGGAFLYLLYLAVVAGLRSTNNYRRAVAIGCTAGIFAILVHSLFDFVLHTTAISVLFLLLIAVLVACRYEYRDDSDTPRVHRGGRKRRPASVTHISSMR